MQIQSSPTDYASYKAQGEYKSQNINIEKKEDAQKLSAELLTQSYIVQFNMLSSEQSKNSLGAQQEALFSINGSIDIKKLESMIDFKSIGYSGKSLSELNPAEASELVGENGFFGIDQTAQRLADFVIKGSGGDEDLLKEGKDGMLQGFKEAEDMFGGKLFDISYKTIEKAVDMIDQYAAENGISLFDQNA